MKTIVQFTFFIIVSCFLFSCGKIRPKGEIVSKDVNVEEFNNLDLEGKFRVFYVRGEKNFVNVETYANIADNLKISVSDKTLKIVEQHETNNVDFYNVTIYSKHSLATLKMKDSVEFNSSSEIKSDNFHLDLKNNAKFIGTIEGRRTELEMADHSLANFRGRSNDAVIKLKDTAGIIAPYWLIGNLDLSDENGSYAEVNVRDTLKGFIKNSAKLLYYNDPIRAFRIDKTATVNNKKLD